MLRKREKFGRKEVAGGRIDIVNGGFETGDYTGWTFYSHNLSGEVVNSENPPEGLWSSKFWGGGPINQEVYIFQWFGSAFPPTKIHFQYKFTQTDYATATAGMYDSKGVWLLNVRLDVAATWTQMEIDVTPSSDSPYRLKLRLTQPGAEYHIDDIYFTG